MDHVLHACRFGHTLLGGIVAASGEGIRCVLLDPRRIYLVEDLAAAGGSRLRVGGDGPAARGAAQILEYLSGDRRRFDVRVAAAGTPFQRKVWAAMSRVGYGRTITYGELAGRAGRPGAARAVGAACGMNPVPIIVPCHRVVAAGCRPGGYTGGLVVKARLLAIEGIEIVGGRLQGAGRGREGGR